MVLQTWYVFVSPAVKMRKTQKVTHAPLLDIYMLRDASDTSPFFHPVPCFQDRHLLINHSGHETLGGGFKYFLFSPLLGQDSHFDSYFSMGLVQPPTSNMCFLKKPVPPSRPWASS